MICICVAKGIQSCSANMIPSDSPAAESNGNHNGSEVRSYMCSAGIRKALICSFIRTPVGRFGGSLQGVGSATLASLVIREAVSRMHIDVNDIDGVILGQGYPNGEAPAIGRVAALDAGLPNSVAGMQVDRRCGSALEAVCIAAMQVQTGVADMVLAGGVENMSQVEHYVPKLRFGRKDSSIALLDRLERARVTAGGKYHLIKGGMIETAENLRRKYGIERREQDQLALLSQERAELAQKQGKFRQETISVQVSTKQGSIELSEDEHPRHGTTLEHLSILPPIMENIYPGATVTAGNSSGQNDGAAICLVTTEERARSISIGPILELVSWACRGVAPEEMGLGPVPATCRALQLAHRTLVDMELIELNEAFAAQVLAVTREWEFREKDFERLNVNGSGISLGHPVGATGVRILCTLAYEMQRRGAEWGLETMCIGGGQGIAAVVRLLK